MPPSKRGPLRDARGQALSCAWRLVSSCGAAPQVSPPNRELASAHTSVSTAQPPRSTPPSSSCALSTHVTCAHPTNEPRSKAAGQTILLVVATRRFESPGAPRRGHFSQLVASAWDTRFQDAARRACMFPIPGERKKYMDYGPQFLKTRPLFAQL